MSPAAPRTHTTNVVVRVALLVIAGLVAVTLAMGGTSASVQTARADTGTPVATTAIAEPSAVVLAKTAAASSAKKVNQDDPAYVKDAKNACKGYKYVTRDRMKYKGKTYSWLYVYKNKSKTKLCFVNLSSHRTHGKKLFRDVYVKRGKKVIASDSGKYKVEADVKVKIKKGGSIHVFADTRTGTSSSHYASLDYVMEG